MKGGVYRMLTDERHNGGSPLFHHQGEGFRTELLAD